MFIVWRKRIITSDRRTELFIEMFCGQKIAPRSGSNAWRPLWCNHKGAGRIAWSPCLMHAERVDGKPRQRLLRKLPTLRSCCMNDPFTLAAWWHRISWWEEFWRDTADGEEGRFFARDKGAIRKKLQEVAPLPSRAGLKAFTTYRLEKEAEWLRKEEERDAAYRRQQEEQERKKAEEEARRADEAKRTRDAFNRAFGRGRSDPAWWDVLGLRATATAEQVKKRYRELAMKHHPDRGGDAEQFKRVQTAYEEAQRALGIK